MSEVKNLVCIACPQGCALKVVIDGDSVEVSGNRCPKGVDYGKQEAVCPMRTITTTVKTEFRDFPRLSVKTDGVIPLGEIFQYMALINQAIVHERKKPGDLVLENMLGSGVNLVATDNMDSLRR